MKDINKIIDSLSSGEQNLMHYKRDSIEALSILLGRMDPDIPLNLMINMRMPIMELYAVFETPEMARLAYAIYLNTQDSLTDIIDNIKYVFRLLNINSEWASPGLRNSLISDLEYVKHLYRLKKILKQQKQRLYLGLLY